MPCSRSPGGVLSQHALQVVSQHALQQVSRGVPGPEGVPGPGGSAPRGCLVGGCLVWRGCSWGGAGIPACTEADLPPPGRDGYCCGRYASHWNAFFLHMQSIQFFLSSVWAGGGGSSSFTQCIKLPLIQSQTARSTSSRGSLLRTRRPVSLLFSGGEERYIWWGRGDVLWVDLPPPHTHTHARANACVSLHVSILLGICSSRCGEQPLCDKNLDTLW